MKRRFNPLPSLFHGFTQVFSLCFNEKNSEGFFAECGKLRNLATAYDVQSAAFSLLDVHEFEPQFEKKPMTLDQIWGDTGLSKYKTLDSNQYESRLNDMNKAELFNEAVRIGLTPIDNRQFLVARLLKEFNKHVGYHKQPEVPKKQEKILSESAIKILREGR